MCLVCKNNAVKLSKGFVEFSNKMNDKFKLNENVVRDFMLIEWFKGFIQKPLDEIHEIFGEIIYWFCFLRKFYSTMGIKLWKLLLSRYFLWSVANRGL